jgi:hypothetical protein
MSDKIALTQTQIMFISVMTDMAIRKILEQTMNLTEEEMREEIAKQETRKNKLMDEITGH